MNLRSLVLCSDEKTTRVLRRVLSDLEIAVEGCADPDDAVKKLTRQRFEAVIVDCDDEDRAARVLASVRSAPCNKRSLAIAMIDSQKATRSAFALGAHFVLYKPISAERARTSFRAVHALMKCERRRNVRITLQIPVTLVSEGSAPKKATTSDIGQGGMSIQLPRTARHAPPLRIKFSLPGTEHLIACAAEMAWKGSGAQSGIRFIDLSPAQREQLNAWLALHSPDIEPDDPPVACRLTDLSSGGCYLEMPAPFPARTRVVLTMRTGSTENRVDGIVRVMHPEGGMGVEFTRTSSQQQDRSQKFIQALKQTGHAHPEVMVEPEGMDDPLDSAQPIADETEDPLLDLFRRSTDFTLESFRTQLRKQRASYHATAHAAADTVSV